MKKIIFTLLILFLLIAAVGCAKKATQETTQESSEEDIGYVSDLDAQLDTSDINSVDEGLELDWV